MVRTEDFSNTFVNYGSPAVSEDQDAWCGSTADRQLANVMAGYWTNFAKSGDPNGKGLPLWPRFNGDDTVLHLSDAIVADRLPNTDQLQVFDEVYQSLRGNP